MAPNVRARQGIVRGLEHIGVQRSCRLGALANGRSALSLLEPLPEARPHKNLSTPSVTLGKNSSSTMRSTSEAKKGSTPL